MYKLTLGGIPLELDRDQGWVLTRGPYPYVMSIPMHIENAKKLLAKGIAPLTLQGDELEVRNLYLIDTSYSDQMDRASIIIADARYWLQYIYLNRYYNVRRTSGTVKGWSAEFPISAETKPEEIYAGYSLKDKTIKYTNHDILEDILKGAAEQLKTLGIPFRYSLGSAFAKESAAAAAIGGMAGAVAGAGAEKKAVEFLVENVVVNGSGDSCLLQVMDDIPGWDMYMSLDGTLTLYDTQEDVGRDVFGKELRKFVPGEEGMLSWPVLASRKNIRPQAMHVLFDRRIEVMWKYDAIHTRAKRPSFFLVDNVCPSPDPILRVGNTLLWGGTYSVIGDASPPVGLLGAWATDTTANPYCTTYGPLSQELIRKHWFNRLDYLEPLFTTWLTAQLEDSPANPTWAARFQALRKHWRQTFQIDPYWWALIQSIEPYRVTFYDRATLARVHSPVYQDYIVRPTNMGIMAGLVRTHGFLTYGAVHRDALSAIAGPGPFDVQVVEPGAGVFHVQSGDPFGRMDRIAPGRPKANLRLPSLLPGEVNALDWLQWTILWVQMELHYEHVMRALLTVIPGYPNNETRFHQVIVTPDKAAKTLGKPIGKCIGPPMVVHIPPEVITADYTWPGLAPFYRDLFANPQLQLGGEFVPSQVTLAEYEAQEAAAFEIVAKTLETGEPLAENLCLNKEHVDNLAAAVAAAFYDDKLDRVEGLGISTPLDATITPQGELGDVSHVFKATGERITTLHAPKVGSRASYWRYLQANTRKYILKQLP